MNISTASWNEIVEGERVAQNIKRMYSVCLGTNAEESHDFSVSKEKERCLSIALDTKLFSFFHCTSISFTESITQSIPYKADKAKEQP